MSESGNGGKGTPQQQKSESDAYSEVADVLLALEAELRNLELWQDTPPSQEKLMSQQPFAVDTLTFDEWLQFLFLPRMKRILEVGGPLPQVSGIQSMAEEVYRQVPAQMRTVIELLGKFDAIIQHHHDR